MPAEPQAAFPAVTSAATGADRLRGRLMAQSLAKLLDRVRGAREVLPHLAALERGLIERGTQALTGIPGHWLAKICSQLASLPLPSEDPPLHDLLGRLMDALEMHRSEGDNSPFNMERTVIIEELSHTDFMDVARGVATTIFDDALAEPPQQVAPADSRGVQPR